MTGAIVEGIAAGGLARLVDMAITAAVSRGVERPVIVAHVREMEAKGATPDQITDSLAALALDSEQKARAAISGAGG